MAVGACGLDDVQLGHDALRGGAHGVIAMTTDAKRRKSCIISSLVAVGAGQHAVKSAQQAADRVVAEARGQKALLRVAVAAARSQRVVMDVVALMAGRARLGKTGQLAPARVTGQAAQAIVRAADWLHGATVAVRQAACIPEVACDGQVAAAAVAPLLTAMSVLLIVAAMAAVTGLIRDLEGQRLGLGRRGFWSLVTRATAPLRRDLLVASDQREAGVAVVVETQERAFGICAPASTSKSPDARPPAAALMTARAVLAYAASVYVHMTAGAAAQQLAVCESCAAAAPLVTALARAVGKAGMASGKWKADLAMIQRRHAANGLEVEQIGALATMLLVTVAASAAARKLTTMQSTLRQHAGLDVLMARQTLLVGLLEVLTMTLHAAEALMHGRERSGRDRHDLCQGAARRAQDRQYGDGS